MTSEFKELEQKLSVPEVPKPRTFNITTGKSPEGVPIFETVEGHQVEITTNGDLLIFYFSFNMTPAGYQPNALLRHAYAKFMWKEIHEVMLTSSVLFN